MRLLVFVLVAAVTFAKAALSESSSTPRATASSTTKEAFEEILSRRSTTFDPDKEGLNTIYLCSAIGCVVGAIISFIFFILAVSGTLCKPKKDKDIDSNML
ncbi:hypothetical protein QR680_009409 [Steinernema hermaphroditum]|uniref:Uncharacterized protein n=1 Tax=Steinernema hermaphroditum TaxID=289476 RepID=A0AA39M8S6_9BILA|nr:hypothetical protein QR680_009409 [Steinernema hermaphroditum]